MLLLSVLSTPLETLLQSMGSFCGQTRMRRDISPASRMFHGIAIRGCDTHTDYLIDSATTVWMGAIAVIALIAGYLFKKHPIEAPEVEDVVAAEIRRQRERGQISAQP